MFPKNNPTEAMTVDMLARTAIFCTLLFPHVLSFHGQRPAVHRTRMMQMRALSVGEKVLVAGAVTPLGRLCADRLMQNKLKVVAFVPVGTLERGRSLLPAGAQVLEAGDGSKFPSGVTGLVCATEKPLTPQAVLDSIEELGSTLKKVVLLSRAGASQNGAGFVIQNALSMGLLEKYKLLEKSVLSACMARGLACTIIRTGKLRGGGGQDGLGELYYKSNPDFAGSLEDSLFDTQMRGAGVAKGDSVNKDANRILVASTIAQVCLRDTPQELCVWSEKGKDWLAAGQLTTELSSL